MSKAATDIMANPVSNVEILDTNRPSLLSNNLNKNQNNDTGDNKNDDENKPEILRNGGESTKKKSKLINKKKTKSKVNNKNIVIGIDLGTCNSCVSFWRNGKIEVIPDEHGFRTIPSNVAFYKGVKYVGIEAKNQMISNPKDTYHNVKRFIGLKYSDENVQKEIKRLTYTTGTDERDNIYIIDSNNQSQRWSPEQISAMVLSKLKLMAESYLGFPVEKAVVTVPAYFIDSQRQATKDACKIAGLDCVRIINEPTAAALAYGFNKKEEKNLNIVVYDLGGGTLDVVLLNINKGMFRAIQSSGNTHLGGEDFDNKIIKYAIKYFCKNNKIDKKTKFTPESMQTLKRSCEKAKRFLSENESAIINVPKFYNNLDLVLKLTRTEFEKICEDLFFSCLRFVSRLMKIANMEPKEIDEVVLVGGSTRMPRIKRDLESYFGKSQTNNFKSKVVESDDSDTPKKGNKKSERKTKRINDSVNPDEVVSQGAAILGYMMYNKDDPFWSDVVLSDVLPLSLGVEVMRKQFAKIIPRGTPIPISKTKKFSTDKDNAKSVDINIYEGERKLSKDNYKLGHFRLSGIDPAPRGVPQIEITIKVDYNGIVDVTAVDKKNTNIKKTLRITDNKGRLTKSQIEKMIQEAKDQEVRDKIFSEKHMLKYEINDMCKTILENMNDKAFSLKDNDKTEIKEDVEAILTWLKNSTNNKKKVEEYKNVYDNIKKNYGSLILRTIKSETKFKSINTAEEGQGTTVYNVDDENTAESIFEKIDKDDIVTGLTEYEKKKALKNRQQLTDLCNSLKEVLNNKDLKLPLEEKLLLQNKIDNAIMWVHVVERANPEEYLKKIHEINEMCNELILKNNLNDKASFNIDGKPVEKIFSNEKSKNQTSKQKLEQLVYSLKHSLNTGMIPPLYKKILQSIVDKVIDWIFVNQDSIKDMDEKYIKKYDELNEFCQKLYEKMNSTNIKTKKVLKQKEYIKSSNGRNPLEKSNEPKEKNMKNNSKKSSLSGGKEIALID